MDTTAQRSPLRSLNFAALRIKDAVCDQLRERTGERPNVDTRAPDLQLLLHLGEQRATLYVDASGESLFKRGWREDKGDAPLKETLAAAMLAAAGWRGTPDAGGALHDPCCGSRHHRHRSGADRLRHRAGAEAALRLRAAAALRHADRCAR